MTCWPVSSFCNTRGNQTSPVFSSTLPISDEMVNITVLKKFLNALQELSSKDTNLKSFELSVASEDLDPNHYLPTPRRLWSKAIATVIGAERIAERIVSLSARALYFLDKYWFEASGTNNFCLSISITSHSSLWEALQLCVREWRYPGMMPYFHQCHCQVSFVLRSKLVTPQANNYMKHPPFLEMPASSKPRRVERMRSPGLQLNEGWPPQNASDAIVTPEDQATAGPVLVTVVSSLGCKFPPESFK